MSKQPRMTREELVRQLQLRNDALEDFLNNVSPLPKERHPHTLVAYRKWVEPSLGIQRITSKSHTDFKQLTAANNLEAAQLVSATVKLFSAAKAAKSGLPRGASRTLGEQVKTATEKKQTAERQRESMASQYIKIAARVDDLEEKLASSKARLLIEQEKNIELTKQINILARPSNVFDINLKTKNREAPWTKPVDPQFLYQKNDAALKANCIVFPSSFSPPGKRSRRRTVGFATWHYRASSS